MGSLLNPHAMNPAAATWTRLPLTGVRVVLPAQTYCHPVYELCDKTMGNILAPVWSLRNVAVRLVCRTVFICVCAFIGMMVRRPGRVAMLLRCYETLNKPLKLRGK